MLRFATALALTLTACASPQAVQEEPAAKKVVLIAGDEEYRSEEALPQLAAILSEHHGFETTVLVATDKETGKINPNVRDNISGLEALDDADLMVIFTRWRILPDEQMAHIDRYLKAGKPVVALRTATHAFAPPEDVHPQVLAYLRATAKADHPDEVERPEVADEAWGAYGHYGDGYFGPKQKWRDGFGRLVVGERWVSHHGKHKHESTRGILNADRQDHPILRGLRDGDIWGPSDVYTIRLQVATDIEPLVFGQVLARKGEFDESDVHYGMRPDDGPPVEEKNDPMMPVAWTKKYRLPDGQSEGRVFSTTMGASTDLLSEGTRRMILQGAFWAMGLEDRIPADGLQVDLVGEFSPTAFEFRDKSDW